MTRTEPPVLPLDARIERLGEATVIRIPLRIEELRIAKETFVTERVGVRAAVSRAVARAGETVGREAPAVGPAGDLDETRPLDLTMPIAGQPEGEADPLRWAHRIDRAKPEK